ncbi:MAG TPA: hypothetical protein VNV37_08070 [Solirubrobacteraceae bacterium]|jgi:hypothetical protein|nr:hypothetical protein [Solirubrobacteraceae bacterium]
MEPPPWALPGSAPASAPAPSVDRPRSRVPPRHGQTLLGSGARVRRVLLVACVVALTPAAVSYVAAILAPSNSSFGIRSVEWLRDHGAAGLVTRIESFYYSLEAPAKGGPALRALPRVGVAGASTGVGTGRAQVVDRPPRILALARPALPGEGVWRPTQPGESRDDPPLLLSTFRSDPAEYPRLVAGVAWINTSRTTIWLYAGREQPSVELPSRGPMDVPPSERGRLLATFNSGFKLADANGGWALHGHAYAPMRDGQATFVRYADGRYDVIDWRGGPRVPADVVFARQNLPLIVAGGRPNPNLSDGPEWGATLGNAVQVWRSGLGVDRRGNLIYAAANYQTVGSLAAILMHAGAVRAMELDINSYWTTFNAYARPGARAPFKLLEEMERPAERYLTPDDRDFFAVYLR